MPAKSKSQQRAMGAAEHGAEFPLAKKLRRSMSKRQLHDFAVGPMKGKPEHVKKRSKAKSKRRAPAFVPGSTEF